MGVRLRQSALLRQCVFLARPPALLAVVGQPRHPRHISDPEGDKPERAARPVRPMMSCRSDPARVTTSRHGDTADQEELWVGRCRCSIWQSAACGQAVQANCGSVMPARASSRLREVAWNLPGPAAAAAAASSTWWSAHSRHTIPRHTSHLGGRKTELCLGKQMQVTNLQMKAVRLSERQSWGFHECHPSFDGDWLYSRSQIECQHASFLSEPCFSVFCR